MTPTYTARHAIIWHNDTLPMTVTQATKAAHDLLELAITEKSAGYSAEWVGHLAPLVAAIRKAKEQERALPVEIAA